MFELNFQENKKDKRNQAIFLLVFFGLLSIMMWLAGNITTSGFELLDMIQFKQVEIKLNETTSFLYLERGQDMFQVEFPDKFEVAVKKP